MERFFCSCGVHVLLLALVLFFLKDCSCKQQYALNVPRVLLPLVPASGIKSNFTLTSTHGCFTWSSTKPDVASVEPILEPNGKGSCSRKAIVTAQSTQTIRLSSVIVAEEAGGGIVLRCDVFVDTIQRIEITTRTRELLLEEEPERFELQAFDDEGNMFSTLNGHILDWLLLPDEEATHQQAEPESILNFILFDESTYSTDPAIRKLESEGLHGDTVLVAGVNTGSAKVQVSLVDKIWKKVQPNVVRLLVIENLMLQPCRDIYILPLSFIEYHVERKKHGHTEVVVLPSDQYSLRISNGTVGELDTKKSRVTGLVLGYTEVILQVKNMMHMPTATKPTAGIHVVAPHHLGFTISPDNVWVLETGRKYIITVHIFEKNNRKVLLTKNVPLSTTLPTKYLESHFSSTNGSYHHVTALQRGSTSLLSTLSSMKHPLTGVLHDLPNSLTVSRKQSLEIYDPIQLEPKRLAFLWDPQSLFHYQHILKASGGSGTYVWSCDPEGVVHVAANGTLTAVNKGNALVFAADVKNTAHYNQTEVYVVPPAKMKFLPSPVEAIIGHTLSLPLQVMGYVDQDESELVTFQDCRRLNLDLAFSDSSIFNISKDRGNTSVIPEGACLVFTALAVNPGHTRLIISYTYEQSIFMETIITIAAYPPLVPIDPETVAVVTLGSSKRFIFEGGPLPWILDRSKFFKNVTGHSLGHLKIESLTPARVDVSQHVYEVMCRELGEQTLSVTVGNNPTYRNHYPATEQASSRIVCALPVSVTMHPVLSHKPDCPLYGQDSGQVLQFPVLCGEKLDLEVEMYDAENRPFDNFTSLELLLTSSNNHLFPLSPPTYINHHGNKAFLTVAVGNEPGSVVVTVTCARHNQSYLAQQAVVFKEPFNPPVSLSLSLLLRNEPVLSPSFLLLYNHHDNHATITIKHGSRHFRINQVTKSYSPADVSYSPEDQRIDVTPMGEGNMKITVEDLCLEVERVATVDVVVGGVHKMEVMVADKVQVGNSTLACIQVLNHDDQPFTASQLKYMNLQPFPKSSHIAVRPAPKDSSATPHSQYLTHGRCDTVEGVHSGSAYLSFNITTVNGKLLSSRPKEIQVFDPLKLLPENITLLPTATFQIQSSGGPKPQASILYSTSNDAVAAVSDTGLILAQEPGKAVAVGKVEIGDPSNPASLTFSQDTVNIRVINLTGVKIFIPTPRLLSGVSIAIYALGLENESPFTFASCIPGLTFQWSVSNMDALTLSSSYERAGTSLQEEQDFDAVLHTRNPGQGTIRLIAKCPPGLCTPDQATFTDQVQVQVLPLLTLLRPLNGHFLLPHNGMARIVTNRDGVSDLSYHLLQGPNGVRNQVITVGKQGDIAAGTVSGHAVVMVTESEEVFGLNQTLLVHVEVRPVASLSITPLSLAQATPNSKYHAFPLGYSADFIASLHDNVGRMFDFADSSLSHRLNHFDVVLVTPESGNTTYRIKATKQGHVILKIWMTSFPHIADYIRIRVGYAILPSLAVVHLGSPVCFSTHLTEDTPGWWSVGEESVMELQPETGVGRALSVGRTVIYHKIKDIVDTHTEITVDKVAHVTFNVSREQLQPFTNSHRRDEAGGYHVPVDFLLPNRDHLTPIHTSPNKECVKIKMDALPTSPQGIHYIQQVPFDCQLELNDHMGADAMATKFIEAQATFDPYSSASYCKLLPSPRNINSGEALSTRDGLKLSMKVMAYDFSRTYFIVSESLDVPFIPAFFVSRKKVLLNAADTSVEVTISGLPQQLQALKATSPYPLSAVKVRNLSPTAVVFRISLLSDYHCPPEPPFSDLNLTFFSPLTQQEDVISVTFLELSDGQAPPGNIPSKPPVLPSKKAAPSFSSYFIIVPVGLFMVAIVMCMALNRAATNSASGFQAKLPPESAASTPHHALLSPMTSPMTSPQQTFQRTPAYNPSQQYTPQVAGSASSTAYKRRTGFSSSPGQHGLFSQ